MLERQLADRSSSWAPVLLEKHQAAVRAGRGAAWLRLAKQGGAEKLRAALYEYAEKESGCGSILADTTVGNVRDEVGRSMLAVAAWQGKYEVCELLVTEWKKIAASIAALHAQVLYEEAEMSLLVVARQVFAVDVNQRFGPWANSEGWTPFAIAAFCGHANVVGLLRRHGANPLLGTSFHSDAFVVAASSPSPNAVAVGMDENGREVLLLEGVMEEYKMITSATQDASERRPINLTVDGKPLEMLTNGISTGSASAVSPSKKHKQLTQAKALDAGINPEVGESDIGPKESDEEIEKVELQRKAYSKEPAMSSFQVLKITGSYGEMDW
jgi:hypothetical protein